MSTVTAARIAREYVTPGHPIAFSSPGAVFRHYEGEVPLKVITKALESVDAYTRHREIKRPAVFNPFYSYQRRTDYQADLIDMSALKRANSYYAFLLVVIDVFTRKVWVMPLKKKSAASMADALRHWLADQVERGGRRERQLYTDRGKEFVAARVGQLLREYGFRHTTSQRGLYKAAIAERVNKTLQIKIYKYLSHTGKSRYVDVLPEIVGSYNNAKHSTLEHELSPEEADLPENEERVREIHGNRYRSVMEKADRTRKKQKFKKGQLVRITLAKGRKVGPEGRAYTPFFSDELFVVVACLRRMPVPKYRLRSMLTLRTAPGSFYANELTRQRRGLFKIDKVLRSRVENGETLKLVRLRGLHPGFDSWVKETDIDQHRRIAVDKLARPPTHASLDEIVQRDAAEDTDGGDSG